MGTSSTPPNSTPRLARLSQDTSAIRSARTNILKSCQLRLPALISKPHTMHMKTLLFWWHYITSPSFRAYVHLHDLQSFYNNIENKRRDMLEHQRRDALIAEFGYEQGQSIFLQERVMADHARR